MPNHLATETSPYLQQHADNPVDWHPWNEEALALARREDKPILLSIGYSACHWCHVMAHESFEDAEVAAVMNKLFVNIKVDREERPDLDQIYQTAHQILAQRSGGWPLTMFLTPDGVPFFSGTYFPKTPRYNLPGFVGLLEQIAEVYRSKRSEIAAQNQGVLAALAQTLPSGAAHHSAHHSNFSTAPVQRAVDVLASNFDERWGGFGRAPKFPHPTDLELLLRDASAQALSIATTTLSRMAEGGIYDHLGGGFSRYSVDERWEIPHFEKMLYDNGPLLKLYADAWRLTGDARYRSVVEETAAWVMREMQAPAGGYFSALDADSEGEEGKFYVWSRDEISALLTPDEYAVSAAYWGLLDAPNFEAAHWHLRAATPIANVAAEQERTLAECEHLLAAARSKLFAVRETRIRPGRDEKILVSWNALMIEGMAHAGRIFQRPAWIASARQALDFIRQTMWRDGRLLATSKDGRAHLNAYLDDYAFLLAALIELMQCDFVLDDLLFAEDLAEALLDVFEDRTGAGAFFFTSHDHERLIHRPKPGHDNAMPSGNGVAARALQRLALLTGEQRYADAAERTLVLFYRELSHNASGFASLLMALDEWCTPCDIVILRGPTDALAAWRTALAEAGHARLKSLILALPNALNDLPPTLSKPISHTVNAWICQGVNCLPPVTELETLLKALCKPSKVK
jgi:uncharacterized protein YyaL (SSP411 family)